MGSKMTPMGAVVRGVLAGAAGTAIMDGVWYARYRRDGGTSGFPAWETAAGLDGWQDAPAPAQVGKRVMEGLRQRELKPERARLVTNLVHWAYGIAWGAGYGIVAASTRRPRARFGLLFGPIVWSTAYLVLPPTGIYQPMRHYDAKILWKDASAHLAYGVGTAASFKLLAGR
ncbi:MAG TPA: hypothetical protein VFA46_20280 [Actinomycetes bacterium]|jgi:hypothetical protein|nr:hypothetical protein [Actinomycetes bacterium]